MPSVTGHPVNVANFRTLITTCTYFGGKYNPVNAAIKLPALNDLAAQAEAAMNDLKNALPAWEKAVNLRAAAYKAVNALVTRLLNAYEATGGDAALLDALKALAKKIKGQRSTDKPKPSGTEPTDKSVSASQMDYDSRWNNFDALVKKFQFETSFVPAEEDLQIGVLVALSAALKAHNAAVDEAYQPVKLARALRDEVLYHPKTGLVALALLVKKYVKSVYGATSPQFKQVNGLKFRTFTS